MQLQAKYVALALLNKRPMTGYEIKKDFEGVISFFFDGSYGSVYPTLKNLEKEGCIEKRTIVQEDRPNKNEFSITDDGKKLLAQYFEQPVGEDSVRSDICMRLFFGGDAGTDEMRAWIGQSVSQHESKLKKLQDIHDRHRQNMPSHQLLSLTIGIGYHKGQLRALSDCVQLLEQSEGGNK
ncbi:PadR family transcriptional regulator [Paenibacillus sp. MBLB4367]|uniref:PadR family transcriptional regulator n=1 Tax=Paenibacillus sp. MBLB4367 TaxID=3384767 RepID=UPI0039080088